MNRLEEVDVDKEVELACAGVDMACEEVELVCDEVELAWETVVEPEEDEEPDKRNRC